MVEKLGVPLRQEADGAEHDVLHHHFTPPREMIFEVRSSERMGSCCWFDMPA